MFEFFRGFFVDPAEARRFFTKWLLDKPGVDLDAISWDRNHAEVMFNLERHLRAAGRLDEELFDAMGLLKPGRKGDIENLRCNHPLRTKNTSRTATKTVVVTEPPEETNKEERDFGAWVLGNVGVTEARELPELYNASSFSNLPPDALAVFFWALRLDEFQLKHFSIRFVSGFESGPGFGTHFSALIADVPSDEFEEIEAAFDEHRQLVTVVAPGWFWAKYHELELPVLMEPDSDLDW